MSDLKSEPLATPHFKQLLDQCVHCGLCLPACPTYAVFATEMDNPRGRIALMRAVSDGRIGVDGAFREHIDRCLACRACEPACPSGVHYGELVESARDAISDQRTQRLAERVIRRVALRELMPHPSRLRLLAQLMRAYQVTGLERVANHILRGRLAGMHALLPRLLAHDAAYAQPARAIGTRRGAVAFFRGCLQEALLADVNAATVRVLQQNGYDVHFLQGETCCGAAQLHVGEGDLARELARRNIQAYDSTQRAGIEFAAIINNAGGCGAQLKEYTRLLQDDRVFAEPAREFASRVQDIAEFLDWHSCVPPRGRVDARVTYVDSCHLRNAQRIIRQPRDLLRAIPGVELIELAHPDRCCGSAGVYNIVQPEIANELLDGKMADIAATRADIIVISNTGCHLQLLNGVKRAHSPARVVHWVQLLDQSYAVAGTA